MEVGNVDGIQVMQARIVNGAIPATAPPVVGKARFIKQAALPIIRNAGCWVR